MEPTPTLSTRLWLVRHAQTDWNRDGRIQGHTPTDLNDAGRAEAMELAAFFATRRFAAFVSSDLPRAKTTATLIAERHGADVLTDVRLRERSFGPWEGQTMAAVREARRQIPGVDPLGNDLAAWSDVPGVEPDAEVNARMIAALRDISARWPEGDVLIVTHGGVLSRLIFETLGIPRHHPRHFPLANGITAVFTWKESALRLASLMDVNLVVNGVVSRDTATVSELGLVREMRGLVC
jgi:broad specificity phosphatase PhoE